VRGSSLWADIVFADVKITCYLKIAYMIVGVRKFHSNCMSYVKPVKYVFKEISTRFCMSGIDCLLSKFCDFPVSESLFN
jgi:hypothetical protein